MFYNGFEGTLDFGFTYCRSSLGAGTLCFTMVLKGVLCCVVLSCGLCCVGLCCVALCVVCCVFVSGRREGRRREWRCQGKNRTPHLGCGEIEE